MPISIFYSWQSDLPNTLNRWLIRRALDDAVGKINADLAVEDAIRIDQDTQDVPGSPAITDTILRKIEECDVFVPDVTFVVGSDEERPSPNPNVMIEYGYALKVCGDQRIIPIFNTAFGDCEKLPFDMRHKRHPRRYEASKELDEEERRKARKQLSVLVERELRLMYESGLLGAHRKVAPPSFEPMPAKDGLGGSFLEPDEEVGIARSLRGIGGKDQHLKLYNGSLIYMRLWPRTSITEFSNPEIKDFIQAAQLRPMCSLPGTGWSYGRNKYGAFSFETMGEDEGLVTGLTQLFRKGEIWGIDTYSLNRELHDGKKSIPTSAVERDLNSTLDNYLQAAQKHLKLPLPLELRVGMARIQGYTLAVPRKYFFKAFAGNIFSPSFEHAAHVDSYDVEPAELLLPFFKKIYDEAGEVRPQI